MLENTCLSRGGEAGVRLRTVDWANNPLGPVERWPLSLQTAVRIVLSSDFPMMVHWGPELITFYNDAYAPSLGHKHPGNLGRPALEWWSEMWDQLTPIFDKVLSGQSFFVENARYTPDRDGVQEEAYFTHCHSPLWDDEGRVAGIFLVVKETTRQIVAERDLLHTNDVLAQQNAALRESEARMRAVVTASSEALYSMSADWRELHHLTGNGFLADTVTTNPDWLEDYIPAEEQQRVRAVIQAAIRAKDLFHLEHRVCRSDGSVGWALSRAVPILDRADQIIEWFGMASDITARRSAEDALQALNEELEQRVAERAAELDRMWETSPDLLLVIGFNGIFQRVNPAWASVLGYLPSDLIGHHVNKFVLPEDHPATSDAYKLAAAGGQPRMVNRYRHKGGSIRWISWVAAPTGIEIYATGRDVTMEKEQADALAEAQDALRQSQKMDAVGQLTGGVAHDFNNLLTIIRSSVNFLQRPDLNEERRDRYLDAVVDTVERASKLTGQLLAFARRQTLSPEVFDVGAKVLGTAEMLNSVTGALIRITTELPDEPCYVKADLSQFETALVNMAVNARDAMGGQGELVLRLDGGRTLPMIRGHAGASTPFAAVSVADTGSGISPHQIARIFEPFFTTKEVGKGTGLGLSQVFGFAKQSGGDVDVASAVDQGTTFTLYLPEVAAPKAGVPAKPGALVSAAGAGECVLVVEDNIEVGRFCTQLLEDLGYRTSWATTAEEALERLGTDGSGFDVVFSDVVMPGMGGIQLARHLHQVLPGLPVVLTSGYSHVLAQEEDHGFQLVHKPYAAEQVGRVLRQVIGQALDPEPRTSPGR